MNIVTRKNFTKIEQNRANNDVAWSFENGIVYLNFESFGVPIDLMLESIYL